MSMSFLAEDIVKMLKKVYELKKVSFKMAKEDAMLILQNEVKDVAVIESVLDQLIEYVYDEESYDFVYDFCEYFESINKKSGKFYKMQLKLEYM